MIASKGAGDVFLMELPSLRPSSMGPRPVGRGSDAGVDTYVNVNNHYEGSALTIRRLLEILRK